VPKRQTILTTAQHLFGRYGLKKVTTDEIARAAHVSKATIYQYYGNKKDILADVVRNEMDELLGAIDAAVAAERTVETKLRAHLLTKIAAVHELINLHHVTNESLAELWDGAKDLRDKFLAEETRVIRDILQGGVDEGRLEIENVQATAHFMSLSLGSLECPWDVDGLNLTVPEQTDIMLDIMLNGLRKRE